MQQFAHYERKESGFLRTLGYVIPVHEDILATRMAM